MDAKIIRKLLANRTLRIDDVLTSADFKVLEGMLEPEVPDNTVRGLHLPGSVTFYMGGWWQIDSIDWQGKKVHLKKVEGSDDCVVQHRHSRMHNPVGSAAKEDAIVKLLRNFKVVRGPIFFQTGRVYTDYGQRMGAQELPDGSIIFCDIDRNIQGRFTPENVKKHEIELTQEKIMWGYDHHELTQYWVAVYQFDEQIAALQKATREHFKGSKRV